MRALREQDFDQMAERVVDRFMGGAKLADAATAEAMGGELNPDQIARMVQAANTQAFLRLMDQQKAQGVPDMTNEFDPIDARQVMQQLMGQVDVPHMDSGGAGEPGMPHAEPDGDEGPLPNEMQHGMPPGMQPPGMQPPGMPPGMQPPGEGEAPQAMGNEPKAPPIDDDNDGPFPKGDKQKAKDDGDKKQKAKDDDKKDKPKKESPFPPKKDEAKEAAFRARRMRKLADILDDQYKQAELAFEDAFENLQLHLRRAHGAPTSTAFEKDALALHGHPIGVVVLNMVKEGQGLPPVAFDDANIKTAALADRHLVDDTEPNRIFASMVKIAMDAARLKSGAEYARTQCS